MSVLRETVVIVGISVEEAEKIKVAHGDTESELLDYWWGAIGELGGELKEINSGYDTPIEYLGWSISDGWDIVELDDHLLSLAKDIATKLNDKYFTDKFKIYAGVFTC